MKLLKEAQKQPDRKQPLIVGFGGHSVVTCGNGREAVQQLSLPQIDLVITDLSMPEMDGLELIKVLSFEWPDIRS